jgi:hypothetical protein
MANDRFTNRLSLLFTSGSTFFLEEISKRIGELLNVEPPKYNKSRGAYNLICRGVKATIVLDYMYCNLRLAPFLERKYLKYLNYKNNLIGPRVKKALGID